MNELQLLTAIRDDLYNASTRMVDNNMKFINDITLNLLTQSDLSEGQIAQLRLVIEISNIMYNNTSRLVLPLEDGVYDLALELLKKYDSNYQIGAKPIKFDEFENQFDNDQQWVTPIKYVDQNAIDDFLYFESLNKRVPLTRELFMKSPIVYDYSISKRTLNTAHNYPKLVGTLDKCKYVLNSQAKERGVFDDQNVKVFERDFIQDHINRGILDPNRKFYMVAELKYDGVSVEADVSNIVHSARSRGDTNNDIATDLSPILAGYKFRFADDIPEDNIFGMKFEAIITYNNLARLSEIRGKEYKNCRNAIIGLFGSSDANQFREFITLIPLATSLEDVDRLTEIEFMNKYYNSGEYLRYAVLYGDYKEILFQVKKFVEEAEYMRDFIPFMYDGVVLSYIEPDLIDALGRENSVNKYSVAIKFNAMKKQSIFTGYTYTIGQNGVVTPMIHYNPVEFYGGIHTKSSGHSYKRFKELGLRIGDIIDIEYTNDVMPYVTKPDIDHNRNNPNPVEEFIDICPSCGNKLKMSDTGKSIICDNIKCPERNLIRMANMMKKLNLKDFSEESFKVINKHSLAELFDLTVDDIAELGEVTSQKFIERMNELKTEPIYDYKIIGAIGFSSIAVEKWKLILNKITLFEIIVDPDDRLYDKLVSIKGIGPGAANTIISEREFFMDDLNVIVNRMNIVSSYGEVSKGKSIRFTGFRDKALIELLCSMGHDASDGGVTKTTDILLVPTEGFTSSKTSKVGENTLIVSVDEFRGNMNKYLA